MSDITITYDYLGEEEKKDIINTQLRDLESTHFSLLMIQPSRLSDANIYQQWEAQKRAVETSLMALRVKKGEIFPNG